MICVRFSGAAFRPEMTQRSEVRGKSGGFPFNLRPSTCFVTIFQYS